MKDSGDQGGSVSIAHSRGQAKDDTELFKQFMDNESFHRWLTDTVFGLKYEQPAA
jgi:hypothetical protein